MKQSFLSKRSLFGRSNAMLILIAIFFFVPWATRAARLSLGKTENKVKDWLPADFRETSELAWFADYFAGERFVLATWPGATAEDQRLKLFAEKLRSEAAGATPDLVPANWEEARKTATELNLMLPSDFSKNWGGRNEKWLISEAGKWYFITPDGRLFRWENEANALHSSIIAMRRMSSDFEVEGTFIAAFGGKPAEGASNPYYNDPALLTAPLFRSVQTGPDVAAQLAAEGGPLWPVDLTDPSLKPRVAQRRAIERLTGTLFAPPVPHEFPWTAKAFEELIAEDDSSAVRDDLTTELQFAIDELVAEEFDGQLAALVEADTKRQSEAWYRVFDAVAIEPPPPLTTVMVTLTELGERNLPYVVGRGVMGGPRGRLLALAEQSGLEAAPVPSAAPPPFNTPEKIGITGRPPLRLGGPPVDNVTIDEEGTITLVRLIGYSVLLGFGLSYICFRSLKVTVMVFVVGGLSAVMGMAFVGWSRTAVDAILLSMPSLVYVLGLSGAIHVVNYYRDEVESRGQTGAAGRALKHALIPCTLAAVTTAIGLMSLYTSNITPIRKFGLFSAIGVISTVAILFAYLPAALETFVPKLKAREKAKNEDIGDGGVLGRFWHAVGIWIVGHYRSVTFVSVVGLLLCTLGLFKIQTSVQLLKLFSSESRIISDYAWLEDHFGKLVPMELVVRMPASEAQPTNDTDAEVPRTMNMLERVEAVSRIQTVVEQAFGERGLGIVGRAMSTATFLPELPDPSNRDHSPTRYRFDQELTAARSELKQTDYFRTENAGPFTDSDLYRISLRVSALSDVDYGRFIYELREAVEPVLEAYRTDEEVADQLAAREDSKQNVVVLGRGQPASLGTEPILRAADQPDEADKIDQRAIYETALAELLRNHARTRVFWHDPAAGSLSGKSNDERWGEQLAAADLVILLRDHGDYDVPFIQQHAQNVVDVRNVPFDRAIPTIVDEIPVSENAGPVQVVYTGVIPVVYKAQRTLLNSLVESIAWAFVLIAVVMAVLLNPGSMPFEWLRPRNLGYGFAAGIVAMIPNIFPVAVVFGLLCHLGVKIDIGTMMTASVAMGVAVDDTIHFLTWFRQNLDAGMNRLEAIRATYRRVGPAMTQTTIVGGLGLFVFALSSFTPTQRFGTLMLMMLLAALVGDLLFFPAILAGPLGRFFKARSPRTSDGPAAATSTALASPAPGSLSNETVMEAATSNDSTVHAVNAEGESFPRQRGIRADRPHNSGTRAKP